MSFSPQFLDELRARLSLAAVVGRSVRLQKRGRDYVGLCPFHKEKSPSFNVVEDKVDVHDLHATLMHCLGLDHKRLIFRHQGRDFRLTDVAGEVIPRLLT